MQHAPGLIAAGSTAVSRALPEGIATFQFDDKTIRVVDLDGAPWFVAADVCGVLYPKTAAPRASISAYLYGLGDDEQQTLLKNSNAGKAHVALFPRSVARCALISESGLYKLILRANASPTAKRFQDWVTREVLPSVRKNGGYVVGQEHLPAQEQAELRRRASSLFELRKAALTGLAEDVAMMRTFMQQQATFRAPLGQP